MSNPKEDLRLGIDLGGSKIYAALLRGDKIVTSDKKRTKAELGYAVVVERIVRLVNTLCKEAQVTPAKLAGVGIGVPSPVVDNRLLEAPNLGWKNAPLGDDLKSALGVRQVRLGNDVNCGALGEAKFGAARDMKSVFALFIGTGLGGGWVRGGRVHEGTSGFAGEVGHIQIPGDTAPCGCGQVGCLEMSASKRGLVRLLQDAQNAGLECQIQELAGLRSRTVEKAYRDGCPSTVQAMQRMATQLAWAMNTIACVVNPHGFVLGGGIGERMGEELVRLMETSRSQATFVASHGPYQVRIGQLGAAAVAFGASALV